MIVKEYKCPLHGFFEAEEPKCPKGCTEGVMRVFLTPPNISTGVVGRMDDEARKLTARFGMTDMKSNLVEGEAQKSAPQNQWAPHFVDFNQGAVNGFSRSGALNVTGTMPTPKAHVAPNLRYDGEAQ